jgi:small subunit ribosomal protein S6
MARHYELTLIVDSQAGDEAVNQTVDKYESYLTDNGADPVVADRRGVRKLAYEIKKHVQADYTYFQFSLVEVAAIHEMDRLLRLDEGVLRHLFIKLDDAPVVPIEASAEPENEDAAGSDEANDSEKDEEGEA